jgi:hypothetical protein
MDVFFFYIFLLQLILGIASFVWLISHRSAVLFSQNKPTTSNQSAVLFSQNKLAPATSQTNKLQFCGT